MSTIFLQPNAIYSPSYACLALSVRVQRTAENFCRNLNSMTELNPNNISQQNLEIKFNYCEPILGICTSSSVNAHEFKLEQKLLDQEEEEDDELRKLLLVNVEELPIVPPSAVEANFTTYFSPDFMKPGHDQYVHRHANGLCVIGLASTHVAFKDEGGIVSVDFNVGKSDRSEIKVTGKRKKNAQHFESNTALCKVCTRDASYIVRCCVNGSLLEVNERLIKKPDLLNSSADREGYIAIIMPKPADWLKNKASLLSIEEYKKVRTEF